jgi:hypothetical protein
MGKFLLVATLALGCGTVQAETLLQAAPPAEPAQAAPAPQAAPATAPAPQATAPDATPAPAAKPKPAKKQQVRRRESDEEKARRIAAKYGVSW